MGDAKHSNGYIISALRLEGALSQEEGRHHDSAAIAQAVDLDRGHLGGRTSVLVLVRMVVPARTGNVEDVRPHQISRPLLGSTSSLPEAIPDSNDTRARQRSAPNGRGPRPLAMEMHASFCMTLRQLLPRPGTKNLSHPLQSILRMRFRILTILGMEIMTNVIMRTLQMLQPSPSRKGKANPKAKAREKAKGKEKEREKARKDDLASG